MLRRKAGGAWRGGVGVGVALLCLTLVMVQPSAWGDPPLFEVTVVVVPVDGGAVLGDGTYVQGETVELTAMPNTGYEFERWKENDETVSTDLVYTFEADENRVLTAHFARLPLVFGLAGRSRGSVDVLPAFALSRHQFELRFDQVQGPGAWGARMSATFSGTNWTSLQVHGSGRLGEIQASTGLVFDPSGPSYRSGFLALMWRGPGLTTGLRVNHRPSVGTPPGPHLLYTWTFRAPPLSLLARFEEAGSGIAFRDLTVQHTGIEVCCGIVARGTMAFSKSGFDYLRVWVRDLVQLDWGPGVWLDFDVRYTVDSKEVQVTPRWGELCGPCVTVYGDFSFDAGLDLHGYKILCCLGEPCPPGSRMRTPYLEFVTAFEPSRVPGGFRGEEFEYVKAGFCGPSCCGGAYEVELTAYFAPTGSLFGLTRLGASFAVPLAEGLRLELDATFHLVDGVTDLGLGWDFRF